MCQLSDCERRRGGACNGVGCVGAVRGRGRAGVRSMRRWGVPLVAVHGRVEAVGPENPGVPKGGSRPGQSGTFESWAALSAPDDFTASWTSRWSSVSAVPTCESVCSTAFDVGDSTPSSVCLFARSNWTNPNASLRYLASSAPRLGPEACTRISMGGFIVSCHVEKESSGLGGGTFIYSLLCNVKCCASGHDQ